MLAEALSAPAGVARQLISDAALYAGVARSLQQQPPAALLTLARGSSDHAAQYLAYLVMARLGHVVASLPMSVVTLYDAKLAAQGLVSLALSQSGQSPDVVIPTQRLRAAGARTVAIVNDERSPLAQAAEHVLPLQAGAERSVAATKSYIAQLVAGARLVATWQGDATLGAALAALPAALEKASQQNWGAAVDALADTERMFVVGRGPGLAVAMEAALKFKETCGIQAEALSAAELRHGPMALVDSGFALLVLAPRGPAQAGLVEVARVMHERGAHVLLAVPDGTPGTEGLQRLPLVCAAHEDLDPIAVVQSVYPMVEALARARGRNPDQPPHLSKVTRTR
jgi:glutamine---fructose-6-phosphate transaminase (isomerizing)